MTTRSTTGAQMTRDVVGRAEVSAQAGTGHGARFRHPRKVFRSPGTRHGVALGCVGLALAAVAGCSGNVGHSAGALTTTSAVRDRHGFAVAPVTATSAPSTRVLAQPASPIAGVPTDNIDALLLSPAQASAVAQATLGNQELMKSPMPAASLGDHADCAVLVHLNDQTFGQQYTAFRLSRLTDGGDDATHYLFQTVATYPDASTARRTFVAAFNPTLLSCDGVTGQDQENKFESTFDVEAGTDDSAQWISTPLVGGKSVGFNCAYEVRVEDNVLFGVRLCQPGEGASAATTALAELISAKVSGIAGR
jgi:PknH-like extracellular domain